VLYLPLQRVDMLLQLLASVLVDLDLVLERWNDDLCILLEVLQLSQDLWVSLFR